MKISASLEERLAKNNAPVDTLVHEGYVLDANAKSNVIPTIPPKPWCFAVADPLPFKNRLMAAGQLYILVECEPNILPVRVLNEETVGEVPMVFSDVQVRNIARPEYARVVQIDGKVLVLDQNEKLSFSPRPSAVVQILIGMEWDHVDERELDKQQKKEGKYRWV